MIRMKTVVGFIGAAAIGALFGNFLIGGILNTRHMGDGDTPAALTVELVGGAVLFAALYAVGMIRSRRNPNR